MSSRVLCDVTLFACYTYVKIEVPHVHCSEGRAGRTLSVQSHLFVSISNSLLCVDVPFWTIHWLKMIVYVVCVAPCHWLSCYIKLWQVWIVQLHLRSYIRYYVIYGPLFVLWDPYTLYGKHACWQFKLLPCLLYIAYAHRNNSVINLIGYCMFQTLKE